MSVQHTKIEFLCIVETVRINNDRYNRENRMFTTMSDFYLCNDINILSILVF